VLRVFGSELKRRGLVGLVRLDVGAERLVCEVPAVAVVARVGSEKLGAFVPTVEGGVAGSKGVALSPIGVLTAGRSLGVRGREGLDEWEGAERVVVDNFEGG